MPIYNPKAQYWHGANSSGGSGVNQTNTVVNSLYGQWKLVSVHSHGAYGRYVDIKTNQTADSQFWMFKVEGYLYNHTLFGTVTCGYSYTEGRILAKEASNYIGGTGHTIETYRTGTGSGENVCLKIDKGSGGYSEGQIDFYMWDFTAANSAGCTTLAAHHSNTSSEIY